MCAVPKLGASPPTWTLPVSLVEAGAEATFLSNTRHRSGTPRSLLPRLGCLPETRTCPSLSYLFPKRNRNTSNCGNPQNEGQNDLRHDYLQLLLTAGPHIQAIGAGADMHDMTDV